MESRVSAKPKPKDNLCRTQPLAVELRRNFGARSERHAWPTATEHSSGSRLLNGIRKLLGRFAFVSHHFILGTQTVREEFRLLPDVVGGPTIYNSLRD